MTTAAQTVKPHQNDKSGKTKHVLQQLTRGEVEESAEEDASEHVNKQEFHSFTHYRASEKVSKKHQFQGSRSPARQDETSPTSHGASRRSPRNIASAKDEMILLKLEKRALNH